MRHYTLLALALLLAPFAPHFAEESWERLGHGTSAKPVGAQSTFDHQDIRDDRVFTYFNLSPGEEKTFRVLLTATYAGDYYLPTASCEAMYDRSIYARKKGQAVSVVKAAAR